jgi:hypothetical protein
MGDGKESSGVIPWVQGLPVLEKPKGRLHFALRAV